MPVPITNQSKGKQSRAALVAFIAVSILWIATVTLSIYLGAQIHSAEAELVRLNSKRANFAAAIHKKSALTNSQIPAENQHSPLTTGAHVSDKPKWIPNPTLVEKAFREAVAKIGYDRLLNRSAANQIAIRLRFHEIYEMLGLSDREISRFEAVAADKNLTFNHLVTSDPEITEAHKRSQAESLDNIVEKTLGHDYVEPFRAFLLTSDLRDFAAELAADSIGSQEPLTPDQVKQILQTSLEYRETKVDCVRIEVDQIDWNAVAVKAQSFLDPSQQKLLGAMIDRRSLDQTFRRITGLPIHPPIRGLP